MTSPTIDIEALKAEDPIRAALERLVNAKPDPVFTAAFDTLRKGAPGLSETTCSALARSIAIKVAHGPEAKAAEASNAELIAQRDGLVDIVRGGMQAVNAAIQMGMAEAAGHERTADKLDKEITNWRFAASAALTTIKTGGES